MAERGSSPVVLARKPISIVLISLYYILAPALNLVQIEFVTGLPLSGPVSLWTVLNPLDWLVLACFPLVGVGLFLVKRWGWIVFVSFSCLLVAYNSFAYFANRVYDFPVVLLYNVTLILVTIVFFRRHLRAPYFNPRLRWWTIGPRFQVHMAAEVVTAESPCEAEVLDISVQGLFLSTCGDIEVGQVHRLVLKTMESPLEVSGRVMRKTTPDAPNPGFGVMFENLDRATQAKVKGLVDRLVKDGARERGLPPDAPDRASPLVKHLAWNAKRLIHEVIGA